MRIWIPPRTISGTSCFFTGYLKKIREYQEGETIYMEIAIPNREVRYVYKQTVLRWFRGKDGGKDADASL